MKVMEKVKTIIAVMMACLPFISHANTTELTCWTVKGEQMKLPVVKTVVEIPDSMAAIDLRGVDAISINCSSANPNCLFYTDATTAVEGLPNANIVCDGICEGLLLTDQACFYCPISFFATDAMLRFTPRIDDENQETDFSQPCHETVILPFDADFVVPENVNGPMPDGWLQMATFCDNDSQMLLFNQSYGDGPKANTPYLVTFAFGVYGTQILFCGQYKMVEETKTTIEDDRSYSFTGTTMSEEEKPGYFRYHRGKDPFFIYLGDGMPMEPFRCFIIDNDKHSGSHQQSGATLEYIVGESESTNIDMPGNNDASPKYYDLLGRPIINPKTGKGIRIAKGAKILR